MVTIKEMSSAMKRAMEWLAAAVAIVIATPAAASTITYYHNDLAGSPVAATNSSAQVIWRESYRPYGERLTKSAASKPNDVWFTSRRQDSTGLVYMGARYYDPVAGRFVSTDPKGLDEANVLSFGRYTYANDNPYKYIDPDGRTSALAYAGGAVLLIGLTYYAISGPERQDQMRQSASQFGAAISRLIFQEDSSDQGGTAASSGQSASKGKEPDAPTASVPENPPNPADFHDPSNLPKGWEWRGRGQPGSREGAYHNPETGESMHDDRTHPSGKEPHWTYTDPSGNRWDNFGGGWKAQ